MKDLTDQEHAITFTEVDLANDEFISHLTLCIGNDHEEALRYFNQIKETYPVYDGEPEIILDFIDSDWSIIDDYSLTRENARQLAMRMGHILEF